MESFFRGRSVALSLAVVLLAVLPVCGADARQSKKPKPTETLRLRLFDANHKPVAGAHVGTFGLFSEKHRGRENADETGLTYSHHCVSQEDGSAKLSAPQGALINFRARVEIVARHAGRGLIALADLDVEECARPVELTLVPECRVSGKFVCPELAKIGRTVGWTNAYLNIGHLNIGQSRIMACDSEQGEIHFVAPPGRYELTGYGRYLCHKNEALTIPEGQREIELTLTRDPTKFALLMGHPAPELRDIAAWKNGRLTLADLKGKCVLLEFWGYWCGPCVDRMPQTFKLYDEFGKQGLVVIGVHVDVTPANVHSVGKLDAKLLSARRNLWHHRDLPFPVAIARPVEKIGAKVVEDYGIESYPTLLLIDRRGILVDIVQEGPEGLPLLQKTLNE